MPKKPEIKKRGKFAYDMTTEELAKRMFPKKVRDEIQRVAQESKVKKK